MAHTHKHLAQVAVVFAIACSPSGDLQDRNQDGVQGSIGTTPLPCSVAQIIQKKCHDCHGPTPFSGAPMSLVTWEDVQRPARSNSAQKVFQQINLRIEDRADPMPPPPGSLTQGEKDHLHGWIQAGAPAGDGCGLPPGQGGTGGAVGGTGGSGAQPSSGGTGAGGSGGGSGGSGGGPVDGSCEPVRILAHGQQVPGDTSPFAVPAIMQNNNQDYMCFYFKSPWNVPTQALKFTPVIDNRAVLHHYLLYSTTTPYADASRASCFGVHTDGTLLTGWAPGSGEWFMPDGVGMELPHGANMNLVLEIHYSNQTGTIQNDASGVEVCATSNLRPNTATVSWLGSEGIIVGPNATATATGSCTPTNQTGPITILRYWPHMHKLGRGMKADIVRVGGVTEPLFNVQNYDFDYQFSYEMTPPAIINPGDRIVTTCSFQNTTPSLVTFGPATEQEMCYNFIIAYPANALEANPDLSGMNRSCIQ